jgi:hypothetical protein
MMTFQEAISAGTLRRCGELVAVAAVATVVGFEAYAAPPSVTPPTVKPAAAHQSALPAVSIRTASLLRKVAFVNPPDRECVKHYEKRVRMSPQAFFQKYGATGTLHCPYRGTSGKTTFASANFVCADNVLALHMHSFIDADSGKIIAYPAECTVTLTGHDGKRMKPIHLTNDVIGDIDIFDKHLTDATREEVLEDPNVDWAVVRTREKAKGVTPYTVFDRNPLVASELADRQLISISAPQEQSCRTISVGCGIRTTNNPRVTEERPRGVFTDCDTGYGASGGADLQEIDGKMVLVGVHTADNHSGGENAPMEWRKDSSKNDFNPQKNATHSVVVERDFLKAIAKMCGSENIAHLPPGNPYDETTDSEPPTIGHK